MRSSSRLLLGNLEKSKRTIWGIAPSKALRAAWDISVPHRPPLELTISRAWLKAPWMSSSRSHLLLASKSRSTESSSKAPTQIQRNGATNMIYPRSSAGETSSPNAWERSKIRVTVALAGPSPQQVYWVIDSASTRMEPLKRACPLKS